MELTPQMKATADAIVSTIKPLLKRLDALEVGNQKGTLELDSLERRASRHAEHLARLESRLKSLETK